MLIGPNHSSIMEELKTNLSETTFMLHNLWMMVATGLVLIMNLGFATLESGLTRSKNTVNVLFKNTITPALGLLMYALVGFNLMYPGHEFAGKFFVFSGFGLHLAHVGETSAYKGTFTYWTDFLFQGMFAATCATIVSGAVAERIKLISYMLFTALFVGFVYPVLGFWKWGEGWLQTMEVPFYDLAGSTLVHSLGGWAALAGILVLGPRIGKYEDGRINPIPGHSMPLAVIGTFMLWLGWLGFNGGSVLSANPGTVSRTLVMTCLAAATGAVSSTFAIHLVSKKYDLSMVLNGILAGLVAITASADQVAVSEALIIGGTAGMLVVSSVLFFDKIKIDDPVGALSVHLVNGIWGTLAVGLFGNLKGGAQLLSQIIGIVSIGSCSFIASLLLFLLLKVTIGIRVTAEEEIEGLDGYEHGMNAYEIELK